MVDSAKRCGDVLGPVPVHLADEAKREMKLGFGLPAGVGDAAHQVQKLVTDGGWRLERDEKPVHCHLASNGPPDASGPPSTHRFGQLFHLPRTEAPPVREECVTTTRSTEAPTP